jgi:FkbM family methyltransferase
MFFNILKKVIRIVKLDRPTRTFNEFFKHINKLGFKPGTVIDVGAEKGTPSLHKAFPESHFILFEPLSIFIPDLEKMMKKYDGEVYNCALGIKEIDGTIFKTKDLSGSSIIHQLNDESDPRLEKITIKTMDGVLGDKDLPKPYLLKTDCQGGDFDVVKGGVSVLRNCELVIMEVSFFKFWGENHPEAFEIFNFMNDNGFVIYDILEGLFRPLDQALGQVDFVFVQKGGMFKKDNRWG